MGLVIHLAESIAADGRSVTVNRCCDLASLVCKESLWVRGVVSVDSERWCGGELGFPILDSRL